MLRSVVCAIVVATVAFIAPAPAGAQSGSPEAGAKVYAAQKCQVCHSVAGVGNKRGPLDGVGTKLSVADIREWIVDPAAAAKKHNSTVKPPMRAYAKLPPQEIDALVAYMKSLTAK